MSDEYTQSDNNGCGVIVAGLFWIVVILGALLYSMWTNPQ